MLPVFQIQQLVNLLSHPFSLVKKNLLEKNYCYALAIILRLKNTRWTETTFSFFGPSPPTFFKGGIIWLLPPVNEELPSIACQMVL
ncbi:MAG: hypothetical protein DRP02_02655 [Candidatus Gerdarchaeota archaeon]|nr:MAG: hypothetical protein DRP02_02655 [Candidatus Gerdarchaeota archaeon]